jgi:Mg2+ and Co2+ transporter CorA
MPSRNPQLLTIPLLRERCREGRWLKVPTAVTGDYGRSVPNPGFGQHSGVITSTTLLVVLSGGLYLLFKRLDWL